MTKAALRGRVRDEVASLQSMSLAELRTFWAGRFGAPPKVRAPNMLRQVLAWRIQADAYGGLDAATIRLIASERASVMVAEQPGTRLAREYGGKRHEVVVLDEGVQYEDQRYGSLSEVARLITGQRWNGPRFFGLRRENVR